MRQNHFFNIRNIPTLFTDIAEDFTETAFCTRVNQGYFFPENEDAVYKPIDFLKWAQIYLKIQSQQMNLFRKFHVRIVGFHGQTVKPKQGSHVWHGFGSRIRGFVIPRMCRAYTAQG